MTRYLRRLGFVVLAGIVAIQAATAQEQKSQRQTSKEVIQSTIKAAGGEEKLLTLFRMKDKLFGGARNSVCEPPLYWWFGEKNRTDNDVLLLWGWTLRPLLDPKSKLQDVPDVKIGDRPAYGIQISETIKPPMTLFFDRETKLLTRIDWRTDEIVFIEWKELDGLKYASKGQSFVKGTGKAQWTTEVLELERLKELPKGVTRDRPPDPKPDKAPEKKPTPPTEKAAVDPERLVGDLTVEESDKAPDKKITVTSPGVYKAVIWQAAGGGGLAEFYDLAADPEAKFNLAGTAGTTKGLIEVGWHGRSFKSPAKQVEKRECCAAHALDPKKSAAENCYDGTMEWPSTAHNKFKVAGEPAVIEKSAARIRIRGTGTFTWWSKHSNEKDAAVTATYTFYPAGQIVLQFRVRMIGKEQTLHWSNEYGPHLLVAANTKDPQKDAGFSFNTLTLTKGEGEQAPAKSEELVLAVSEKVRAALMLTIPAEASALFNRHMHHNGRAIGWDRFGYGSTGHDMPPGYDHTWACLVQVGTQDHKLLPSLRTAQDALPFALQYRAPARIEGAELVKDDAGDFKKDGFNESEACHVLKGSGPLTFTYERGTGAGFAPAFKVIGWKGGTPRSVKVDGKEVPVAGAVVDGRLLLQVLGTVPAVKSKIEVVR